MKTHKMRKTEKEKPFFGSRRIFSFFTGITIWGLIDNPTMPRNDYSYKMNGPYCGLYTEFYIPKDSYKEAYKVLAE